MLLSTTTSIGELRDITEDMDVIPDYGLMDDERLRWMIPYDCFDILVLLLILRSIPSWNAEA